MAAGPQLEWRTLCYIYGLILMFILSLSWIICFLSFSGLTNWPTGMDAQRFLKVTALTLSGVCAVLGVGGATGILSIENRVQLMIWTGLFSGVFVAILAWFKEIVP